MSTDHVFISYRSEDTGDAASRLHQDLARRLGQAAVYLDYERLEPGSPWPAGLLAAVQSARVVFVLIGRRWLTAQNPETGDRRLNLPEDWVRREIEEALKARRHVVPVLVEGAPALTRDALRTVPSIQPIADLQAVPLRRRDWPSDLGRILGLLVDRGFVVPDSAPSEPMGGRLQPPIPWPEGPGPRRWARALRPRTLIGVVGVAAVLLLVGVGSRGGRGPEPTPPVKLDPAVGTRSQPVSRDGTKGEPARSAVELHGAVQVARLWSEKYAQLHENYTIEAREISEPQRLGESPLTEERRFTIPVATAKPISELELAWKWTVPDGFVLWPVIHPPSAGPFDRFAFKRLSDVYDQEKRDVLAEIGSGRFRSADDALRRLQRLLSMFDDPSSKFIPGVSMGELEYKLLQDVCTAAHKFRATQGRSKVSDDEIENERRWRKGQFAAAIRSEQPDRALVRSLNAWADFSREVYSRAQRTWPNRQLSESADVLEQRHYVAWLREDVESVIEQLSWLRGELGQPTLNHRLSSRRRAALDDVLSGSADQVSMSQLVDLLSALVDPYRPTPTPTE